MLMKIAQKWDKFKKPLVKKRQGSMVMELMAYILGGALVLVVGIFAFVLLFDRINVYRAERDMDAIVSGCQAYQYNSATSSLPTELGQLVSGLDSGQTNDGTTVTNFVEKAGKKWTSDSKSFVDPWGNQYQYDVSNQTITSSHNGKTAIVRSW